MDPLALMAVVGLAFAGKKLSDDQPEKKPFVVPSVPSVPDARGRLVNGMTGTYKQSDPMGGVIRPNREIQPNFSDIAESKPVWGQPVYDLYNRQDVSSKMNNLGPVERQNVGPGLGVGSNVASYGGYHQFFRVMPTNTNVQRLTQLPGRSGGPARLVKNSAGQDTTGNLTQQRPPRIFNHEPAAGRAVVTGQAAHESRYVKGEQYTLKDQTVTRADNDGLGNPVFPIDSGHVIAPKDLRPVRRDDSIPDKTGNPGRMNVRADPTGALGAVTAQRNQPWTEAINHKNASGEQQYTLPEFTSFNAFKDTPTPNQDLDLALRQLENNPFNHPLLKV